MIGVSPGGREHGGAQWSVKQITGLLEGSGRALCVITTRCGRFIVYWM